MCGNGEHSASGRASRWEARGERQMASAWSVRVSVGAPGRNWILVGGSRTFLEGGSQMRQKWLMGVFIHRGAGCSEILITYGGWWCAGSPRCGGAVVVARCKGGARLAVRGRAAAGARRMGKRRRVGRRGESAPATWDTRKAAQWWPPPWVEAGGGRLPP